MIHLTIDLFISNMCTTNTYNVYEPQLRIRIVSNICLVFGSLKCMLCIKYLSMVLKSILLSC